MKLDGPSPPSAAENRKLAGELSATFAISSSATTNQESLDSSVPDGAVRVFRSDGGGGARDRGFRRFKRRVCGLDSTINDCAGLPK